MRTGPFSDPAIVNIINRYFIPVHLDNTDGSAKRYGMEPGTENAYIILETPEIAGGTPVVTLILDQLSEVLVEANARRAIVAFLAKHKEFHTPWPEMARLADAIDPESVTRRAELLLDEGDTAGALKLLPATSATPRAALLRARALRLSQRWNDAAVALKGLEASPEIDLERIRLAFDRKRNAEAVRMLDTWLAANQDRPDADEAFFMRGWLHHRAKSDDRAVATWQAGIARHPLASSLYSQKARLTMIRENWELPANVDQEK